MVANLTLTSSVRHTMATASSSSSSVSMYDDHTKPHSGFTHAQLTLFLTWVISLVLWWVQQQGSNSSRHSQNGSGTDAKKQDLESGLGPVAKQRDSLSTASGSGGHAKGSDEDSNDVKAAKPSSPGGVPPVPSLEQTLKNVAVLGLVMLYFFLCDYVKVFPNHERVYNRDTFLFLLFILFLVASAFTVTPTKDVILNRDQTEEWKGWMQVMFVWYHYFAAQEWYNWIRVYIACYVWMTGFGNFSFFWVRGDYSLWRVLKMLFRMNFLVLTIMAVTGNEYMLYYICAMHSYWFITVYVFMRCLTHWNTHRWKMALKFLLYALCNALVFEVPGNCSFLFRPLWFVFQFHDRQNRDLLHEWEFRGGLDHWACFFGMLCAYNYPHFQTFVKYLESPTTNGDRAEALKKVGLKAGMVSAAVAAGFGWYFAFMRQEKFAYNATHCYTSLLPILVLVVLRNSFPVLRRHYLGLFAFLGKVTLETYLSQLHVYLQSNAKHLIGYLPGYPLLNFALATVIYLSLSQVLFHVTVDFSAFFIQKDWRKAARLSAMAGGVLSLSAVCSLIIQPLTASTR